MYTIKFITNWCMIKGLRRFCVSYILGYLSCGTVGKIMASLSSISELSLRNILSHCIKPK